MKNISQPIIFFGTEDFSAVALEGLIAAGFSVAAVVTKPDSQKGRGQKLTPPRVKVIAIEHNIPVWQPRHLSEITEDVRALQPVSGVLVSYGKILPQTTIDLFTPGIINVHPSLLPKYRGPSPIESAIMNDDAVTGVSIMQLSAAMDAGPVYASEHFPLNGHETQPELYVSLANIGTKLLLKLLPSIIAGNLQPIEQDETKASYCSLLEKQVDGLQPLDFSATELERTIRAHLLFPKTRLIVLGHTVIITKAHVVSHQKTPLDIACQSGGFLSIDELIAPSGRTMTANAFLNGYAAA